MNSGSTPSVSASDLSNADDLAVQIAPQLEFQVAGASTFAVVSPVDGDDGNAFAMAEEWLALAGPQGGSKPGPSDEVIGVDAMRIGGTDAGAGDDRRSPLDGREPDVRP